MMGVDGGSKEEVQTAVHAGNIVGEDTEGGVESTKLIALATFLSSSSGSWAALASDAAWAATAEWGLLGEVDVSFAVGADKEGWHVDELLADTDVTLADQGTGVVDGLGHAGAEDQGLQTALQQLLGGQLQHEVQLLLVFGQQLVAQHAAQQGFTFEHALGVLLVQGQQSPGGLTDLREGKLHAPDFALATETVLAAELQLLVDTFLLEGTTGGARRGAVVTVHRDPRHGYDTQ